jgi:hypothetical protein
VWRAALVCSPRGSLHLADLGVPHNKTDWFVLPLPEGLVQQSACARHRILFLFRLTCTSVTLFSALSNTAARVQADQRGMCDSSDDDDDDVEFVDCREPTEAELEILNRPPPARGGNHSQYREAALSIMLHTLTPRIKKARNAAFRKMVEAFNKRVPGHSVRCPLALFKNLHAKVIETGKTCDRPRSGRPSTLNNAQVKKCVAVFKRGVGKLGSKDWYGYSSIDHAAGTNPTIIGVLEKSKVSVNTLWRRMKIYQREQFGAGFKRICIRTKPALAVDVKLERLEFAKKYVNEPLEFWASVFWLDEKQEIIGFPRYHCYARDGQDSFTVEAEKPLGKRCPKLRYIACVNALLGPVFFKLLSGTTDYDSGYTVRTCVPLT